jgi:uncharacterized membrane protein YbhN (UPF0104 family)
VSPSRQVSREQYPKDLPLRAPHLTRRRLETSTPTPTAQREAEPTAAARAGKLATGALRRRLAVRILFFLGSVALLGFTFRHADFAAVRRLLAGAPALWLAPVPYFFVICFDSLGWWLLLRRAGCRLPLHRTLGVRLPAEAVGLSLPSGTVFTEVVALHLLRRRYGVDPAPAVASLAGRRLYLAFGFGVALVASSIAGHRVLAAASPRIIGAPGLEWAGLVAGAALIAGSLGLAAMWTGSAIGERLHRLLLRLPLAPLHRWLERSRETFAAVDRSMARSFAAPVAGMAVTAACFTAVWLTESVETFFFMSLLGAHLTFRQVFSFDTLLTLVRGLVFFVPAGLGFQDFGFVAFLRGLGVANAVTLGAAFVLIKRCKELFWILAGYLLLAWGMWISPPAATPRGVCTNP